MLLYRPVKFSLIIILAIIATIFVNSATTLLASERLDCFDDCEKQSKELKKYARYGSPQAQTILALSYKTGEIHGTVDNAQAWRWMKRAARQRYAPAQYYLSQWHRSGFYKGLDDEKAQAYLQRAADQEYAPALYQLGVIKLSNNEIDDGLALIKASANHGDPNAKRLVARILGKGAKVKTDSASSMGMVTSSVEQIDDDVIRIVGSQLDPLFLFENALDRIHDLSIYDRPGTTGARTGDTKCGQKGSRCRVYKPNSLMDLGSGGGSMGGGGGR